MSDPAGQRRLAAVLVADVSGSSRLIEADEGYALAAIYSALHDTLFRSAARRGGRVFKTLGDGALIEFASPVEAVACAVEVQQELATRAETEPPERRVLLRIGINLGDVLARPDGDLYGDGVNVAARLEPLASPGGISVSGKVYSELQGRLSLAWEDRGEQVLKNIARPVRVYALSSGAEATFGAAGPPLPDKPSIAVLPFQNMSGDPDQEYFVDGMVEDITSSLSRFRWLLVIARNSAFAYKGRSVDLRQIGRELGVRYVLEGSVRKSTGRIRITVQLIEAEGGTHVWTERYDRATDDVFALQDDITINTVAAIEPSLRQAEIERAKRKRPDSLDAYDLVLRAMPAVDTLMPEGAREALPLLERALILDPGYALAHGHAAMCHEILYVRTGQPEENRVEAIRHAHKAIALGQDDATALIYGGNAIGMVEHDRALAQEAFEAALELCPSAAAAYIWGALNLGWGGEAERAIEWGERAIRLSPFDPSITAALHGLFLGHFVRGRYEEAATTARRAIRSKPGFSISHMMLAAALAKVGRLEEARAASARVLALQPGFRGASQCSAVGAVPHVADPLLSALSAAGLPS